MSNKWQQKYGVNLVLMGCIASLFIGCSSPLKYAKTTPSQAPKANSKTMPNNSNCRSPYVVQTGDTLSEIALQCQIDMKTLAKANYLLPPYIVYVNQELVLPYAENSLPQKLSRKKQSKKQTKQVKVVQLDKPSQTAKAIQNSQSSSAAHPWVWPMNKDLRYQFKNDNAGLSVLEVYGVAGQEVKAVADGEVVYAGNGIANFGWMLVIKHANDYMSIYAHNSHLYAKKGDRVKQNQKVASLGATGKAKRPMLYLEARHKGRKIDINKVLTF